MLSANPSLVALSPFLASSFLASRTGKLHARQTRSVPRQRLQVYLHSNHGVLPLIALYLLARWLLRQEEEDLF